MGFFKQKSENDLKDEIIELRAKREKLKAQNAELSKRDALVSELRQTREETRELERKNSGMGRLMNTVKERLNNPRIQKFKSTLGNIGKKIGSTTNKAADNYKKRPNQWDPFAMPGDFQRTTKKRSKDTSMDFFTR